MEDFNKNDKQHNFNQIKGIITELNEGDKFCNITLNVGHENPRAVNLVIKKLVYEAFANKFQVGDKVLVKFYLSSRSKESTDGRPRWNTMANVLQIDSVD